ncbi:MAG: T9SS type A sorting domain-containing protein, partial [Candidatus Marinimicrobia bacterium]|nr:T9SS type A sorting domain-containing protein [Candidatus Neomarinimicrobiota bacterium]
NGPRDIVALDMSGGFGIMDLAVVNLTDNTLTILRNQVPLGIFTNVSLSSTGEQSGDIAISYSIYDVNQGLIGLSCVYSSDLGVTWQPASISGDTSALVPEFHNGTITWLSEVNLPGTDINAIFKITPYSGGTTGTPDSTAVFNVDNYHDHAVQVSMVESLQEYSDSVHIQMVLTDTTWDELSAAGYYRIGAGSWQPATLIGTTANIDSAQYSQSLVWDSRNDLASADLTQVQLKIVPSDGWADGASDATAYFHLDNNEPPTATLTDLSGEQSGDISVGYTLGDSESDTLSIGLFNRPDSSSIWQLCTVSGDTTGITIYDGTITWHSTADLPGRDILTAQLKLVPADNDTGTAAVISNINIDNNAVPAIVLTAPAGEQIGDVVIGFNLADAESDSLSLYAEFKVLGSQIWQAATVMGDTTSITNYADTLIWQSDNDLTEFAGYIDFKVTPADNDAGIPDSIVILVDQVGAPAVISFSIPTGELSGDIEITYSLADDESDAIDLQLEYSLDHGDNWIIGTIVGNTTGIPMNQYSGSCTWQSASDLPGADQDSVTLKLSPWDGHWGAFMIAESFHLDNNQPPEIVLTSLTTIQTDSVLISYSLSDTETDTLALVCEIRIAGSATWNQATIIDDITTVGSGDYQGSFLWTSTIDYPDIHEIIELRVLPNDNDPGTADTISFELDNVYASVSIADYTDEQSGDIVVAYAITNPAGNPVDLQVEVSNNSGQSWIPATVTGTVQGVDQDHYTDSVVWQSESDYPNFEGTNVRIRVTPSDNQVGIPDETANFHLDNNLPPSIVTGSYSDTITTYMDIPYLLSDAESDTLTILGEYSLDQGQSWFMPTLVDALSEVPAAQYADTLVWDVFGDVGFQRLTGVQFRLTPYDLDPGTMAFIDSLTILNYPGDYTGDLIIDTEDLAQFAAAWNDDPQYLPYEIGPATGQVPELSVHPDGLLDFEDLTVFAMMWNWSFANNGFAKSIPPLAKAASGATSLTLVQRIPDNLWDEGATDMLTVDVYVDTDDPLMMVDGVLSFDPLMVKYVGIEEGGYLRQYYQSTPMFAQVSPDSSQVLFAVVGLGKLDEAKETDLPVATIRFKPVTKTTHDLRLSYALRDESGDKVEQSLALVELESFLPEQFVLHQNFPNPFNPNTSLRYELPIATDVVLVVFDILGREVIRLVDEHEEAGYHQVLWQGQDRFGRGLASGVYIYRLVTPQFSRAKKMLLLK